MRLTSPLPLILCAALAACGESARLPSNADVGPTPTLAEPVRTVIPTANVAAARPWQPGQAPTAAPGLQVQALAAGLEHPRWLHVLPNGDVLVAETNAPPRPEEGTGIKGWVMGKLMLKAGSTGTSANRITLLRDADGDGRAEVHEVFLKDLNSPFGMALVGDRFYVANTDAVWSWPYVSGQTTLSGPGQKLTDLPAGPRNHHWTKSLIASPCCPRSPSKSKIALLNQPSMTKMNRTCPSWIRFPKKPKKTSKAGFAPWVRSAPTNPSAP